MFFFFFRFASVSAWQHFYVDVTLYYCNRLMGAPCWEFVEVQTVERQLPYSDSSTSNMSDNSPLHEQKSTQKGVLWSDDWKMLQRAEYAVFLSFIANKEIDWHVMLKWIFYCESWQSQ
jgi:hypothetical protein